MSATSTLLSANLRTRRLYRLHGPGCGHLHRLHRHHALFSNTMTSSFTGNVRNSYRGPHRWSPASSEDEALEHDGRPGRQCILQPSPKDVKTQGVTVAVESQRNTSLQ